MISPSHLFFELKIIRTNYCVLARAVNCSSGSTINQATPLKKQSPAATQNDISHPKCSATNGVKLAVTTPPNCPPIFMTPETEPAERPPMSELTDQNALCAKYRAPAPPARTTLASRASAT